MRRAQIAILLAGIILGSGFGITLSYDPQGPALRATQDNRVSADGSEPSGFFVVRYMEKYAQYCDAEPADRNSKWLHHTACEKSTEIVIAIFTVVLAVFTGCLIGVGIFQWRVTREAMIAGGRAFVFAIDIYPLWRRNDDGSHSWIFRPAWKNSGDTPTKHLVFHTACVVRDSPLPAGFNFDYPTADIGRGLLAPDGILYGGAAPKPNVSQITVRDIIEVQNGLKYIYLFGWATYSDVFAENKLHITRFCWRIDPLGDPTAFDPNSKPGQPGHMQFITLHHPEGNCADEECNAIPIG